METSKKKTAPLTVLIAAVIGSVVGSYVVREVFNRSPSTERMLVMTSEAMNKNLPMMIDQVTRLDATFPGPGKTLNYKYTLVGIKLADLNVDEVKTQISPSITQNYRTNPDMAELRKMSAVLKYHYYDDTGAFAFAIEVDPKTF